MGAVAPVVVAGVTVVDAEGVEAEEGVVRAAEPVMEVAVMAPMLSKIRCMRLREISSRVDRYAACASMTGRIRARVEAGRDANRF